MCRVCPSARLTARNSYRTTGGILIKFGIEEYYKACREIPVLAQTGQNTAEY
jgi:hypothetical protein